MSESEVLKRNQFFVKSLNYRPRASFFRSRGPGRPLVEAVVNLKILMSKENSSEICRIALIGAGVRAQAVVRQMLTLAKGRVEVAAICDPDCEVAEQAREKLEAPDALITNEIGEILARPDIGWIFVSSYNYLHAEHAIAAMKAGKHVFAEKPLATTLEEAVAVCRTIRETGRSFSFGLVLRYSLFYAKLKELLTSGAIGKLVSMEFNETLDFNHGGHIFANWRRFKEFSGGHMLEKCCHDLDLANWLVGSEAVRCASFGGKSFFVPENAHRVAEIGNNAEGLPAYKTWKGRHPYDPFGADSTVLDHQVGIIEYRNGVKATFHTNSNTAMPERRFYLCGTEGTIRADLISGAFEMHRIGFDTVRENVELGVKGGHGGGDTIMASGLVASICDGAPPLATAADGLEACLVAFALTEAAEKGEMIDIDALRQRAEALLA